MSEENMSATEEGPDSPKLDASMKIDSASLTNEEADFARQMGFDGDEDPPPPMKAPIAAAAAPAAEAVVHETSDDDEAESGDSPEGEDREVEAGTDEVVENVASEAPVEAASQPMNHSDESESDSGDFEEIFPRAAADGIQTTLESRADELMQRGASQRSTAAGDSNSSSSDGDLSKLRSDVEAAEASQTALRLQLEERDAELEAYRASAGGNSEATARFEKENEALRSDLDAIGLDRDHLIDQLAVTSGKLVQSKSQAEKLEASLRAARGALTPLPEGERALRAEVIGLRGRLEEAREEYQMLSAELSQSATELAIARARVEDRQHEVNAYIERAEALDEQMAQNDEKLAKTIARHREVLALSARLQSDNNELRSAQAALEETLQARDLEILAREEHLNVTRQGLSSRDAQLVDVNERLDQQTMRCDSQAADLQRGEIERDQLTETIAHRESRIATLTETLARIEEAMGHPLPALDSASREMPQAEWSRPVLAQDTIRTKTKRLQMTPVFTESTEPEFATKSEETTEPEPAPKAAEIATTVETEIPIVVEAADVQEVDVEIDISELGPSEPDDDTETCSSEPILTPPPTLPTILSTWRDRRFGEVTGGVGPATVHGFLAERLRDHLGNPGPDYVFLKSLGGSLADAEVHLVLALRELGVEGVRMDVLDVNPLLADARRQKIELAGLGEVIDVTLGDLEDWEADAPCHAILLSDALSSQANPALFLDHISGTLANGALVLFVDRIASGPVQLSASALIRLEELWDVLPESLATAEGLSIVPHRGDDGGFTQSPNDPAGMLLARLEPIAIAGFGHLADLLVGPKRGSALSIDDDAAMQLLESIMTIDESRSLTEHLAPRHGLGVFAESGTGRTETIGQDWPGDPVEK